MMTRFLHWLDLAFGTALMIALAGVVATLWPADAARAAPITEARPVQAFDEIASSGPWRLAVRSGSTATVGITAEPSVAARIETVVDGRTLVIRPVRGSHDDLRNARDVRVEVTVPALRALRLAGASDARIDAMKTPRLAIALAGSGDVRLAGIEAETLELAIDGSGDVTAAGNVRSLKLSISGSGDVAAGDLAADDVAVRIAGSGDATVHARKTLDVAVAGSGGVAYRGSPTVRQRVAGSGSVRAL